MPEKIDHPHSLTAEEVCKLLDTHENGLTQEEAEKRLVEYGPNRLPPGKGISIFLLIFKQFKSWLVIILLIAAGISWFAGEGIDTWVIIGVVIINAIIGFTQEYKAEKAIKSLGDMIVKTAKVLRNGELITVDTADLVPGDVIVLEEGDSIPADARIFVSKNLRTVEASLTGESLPVDKQTEKMEKDLMLGDQVNMVRKGTFVGGGYAKAVVTGTGINTAIGDISESLGEIETTKTNFMIKTDKLAKQMGYIAIGSSLIVFLVGYFIRDFDITEILMMSIAALVAAVPEGMPAVISIVLAIGANRMAKRNAIIREFTATETLGAVTAILTDKTGTLTQNSLTVRRVFIPGEEEFHITGEGWFPAGNFMQDDAIVEPSKWEPLHKLLQIAAISNNSRIRHKSENDSFELIGDPTEGALLVLARKGGIKAETYESIKLDDLPFDSTTKLRATLVETEDSSINQLLITGAPENLLERSVRYLSENGENELNEEEKEKIRDKISDWSNHALRVIALAYKVEKKDEIDSDTIEDLVFVGIVGMIDPPRKDAREAVEKCKKAGIRVIMVTGDHVNTAVAIAKTCGIIEEDDNSKIKALNDQQLNQLDDDEFDEAIRTVSVFGRLSPKTKLRIANRMQDMGHLIAMTGDGVNDAPALKGADVGIAMGIMGTDVAREAADVVLADDNFATIVNAVEEGRIVFTNSRQTSFFLITTNLAESATLIIAIAIGLPLPLTATQILWLNLVTDGVTDMSLATEQGHGDIMVEKPMRKDENILNKEIMPFMIITVFTMVILSLGAFFHYMDEGVETARTGLFVMLSFTQLFNVYNLRSIHQSVFKIGFFSNKWINLGVGVSALLLILVTEIPAMASIFNFKSLDIPDFLILFALSSLVLWICEFYKWMHHKSNKLNL